MATKLPRRPKKSSTWRDVKDKVAGFDKAGLIQLVSDLYALNRENQAFMHARFSLGVDALQGYKRRISVAIAPNITSTRYAAPSITAARKAISEYNKAVGDPRGLTELRVFWCETAVEFATGFGYEDESYFSALVRQYRDACLGLPEIDEPARREYVERLMRVRNDAMVGYGVQDAMDDWLAEALSKLPEIMETPSAELPDDD